MDNSRNDADVIEIDLMEIVGLLWHRAWIIILCMILGAAIGFGISNYVLTEQFESTTKVYILNKNDSSTITYSDVQLGSQLTKDYAELIKSRYVLEQVIEKCSLNETYKEFSERISVQIPSDTRIIAITVTDPVPANAQILANEIRKAAAEHIKNVMDIQAVNVVDEANLPATPASPSVLKWTAIAALLGAFLCAAVVLVHFMLDDTVKTSDDVEKYLGLSTLGMIPIREDAEHAKKGRKGRKKNKSEKPNAIDIIELETENTVKEEK